ncbi:hypothetical protein SAMN05519104_5416 [Rhizobiales bacterium GAS188]|jgi:hypothetical protein|nr:hypothetical protein SAMN05519104_5416 [Rhizobiales bacterium GAS188]
MHEKGGFVFHSHQSARNGAAIDTFHQACLLPNLFHGSAINRSKLIERLDTRPDHPREMIALSTSTFTSMGKSPKSIICCFRQAVRHCDNIWQRTRDARIGKYLVAPLNRSGRLSASRSAKARAAVSNAVLSKDAFRFSAQADAQHPSVHLFLDVKCVAMVVRYVRHRDGLGGPLSIVNSSAMGRPTGRNFNAPTVHCLHIAQ